ncbi:MAG: S8 family serine peptidase [Promethearchaeota archaeon]
MTLKLKRKSNFIIILLIFVSYFVIPFSGILLNYSNTYNQLEHEFIPKESLSTSLNSEASSKYLNFESQSKSKYAKFDTSLNEYLVNLTLDKTELYKRIQVVVLFEDGISKEERMKIIDSTFDDYKFVRHYDIIPGTYIKINSKQLIDNYQKIEGLKSIKKIFKSNYYKSPYIIEGNLQTSSLNSEDYPNWWVSAVGANNLPYNGSGVKVAVIDTGIYNHPDLNIINNSNFVTDENPLNYDDTLGHGTHVGGIIAGSGESSSGKYRGIAPGALLINARAGNASGLTDTDIISAIEWSATPTSLKGAGADIISMSFGGGYPVLSDLITQTITSARALYGVVFVSSAGNSGPEYLTGSTPASSAESIAVGATNKNNELASFSSWGPTYRYIGYPDVVAPGVDIISTEAPNSIISEEKRLIGDFFDFPGDGDYIPLSGTSMSCPVVAGALAILLEAYPNITPETARIALIEGARKLNDENEADYLKSGAGIINVSASLDYLNNLNESHTNINDIVKIYPDTLPVKPFDLLNFPGDYQKFNLTVISGNSTTYNIEIPNNIQGVSISYNTFLPSYSEIGISFLELGIEITPDAIPGIRNFQINLTVGGVLYDSVNVLLDIRLPESKVLMESYHGLNDWFPEISKFYQMGFYEAIADFTERNISVDYNMEYWTPDYNKNFNNSILTEEKLAQYNLIVLQNPLLPYSSLEIKNLKDYFENGGNIFFLGTRYQDLALENLNYLFSQLDVDIQINEENIMDDNWLGIGTSVSAQTIKNFSNIKLFNNVNDVYWQYGNSFTVSGNAESAATIGNNTVVALYNGTSHGTGSLLAFGDLHWMYYDYQSTNYSQSHFNVLNNIIDFLLPEEQVSININLRSYDIPTSKINLYLYLKNQSSDSPISQSDYDSLEVKIRNSTFTKSIKLNTNFSDNGIYFNNTFNLPLPNYKAYIIEVNLTIGINSYNKVSKILYFDKSEMPQIIQLSSTDRAITRAPIVSTVLEAEMDASTYKNITGYLSIYSHSFYNSKMSVNKTIVLTNQSLNMYSYNFDPATSDPSGFGIYYIVPVNSNYTNPYSPRYDFEIVNNPPSILKSSSSFNLVGYGDVYFDETESDKGSYVYTATQGDKFIFAVNVRDSVNYEDPSSNMRVFVNLFTCSVSGDNYIFLIPPHTIEVTELNYETSSGKYEGSFIIPDTMLYSSITGIKPISTAAGFNFDTSEGYLSLFYITVYDSEGETDDFIIILKISVPPIDISLLIIIIISIVALIGVVSLFVYYARKKKYPRTTQIQPIYEDIYYSPAYDEPSEESYLVPDSLSSVGASFYCPFCGHALRTPKKFCPSCGESLEFFNQNEENNVENGTNND